MMDAYDDAHSLEHAGNKRRTTLQPTPCTDFRRSGDRRTRLSDAASPSRCRFAWRWIPRFRAQRESQST